jgi:hypothetical protein
MARRISGRERERLHTCRRASIEMAPWPERSTRRGCAEAVGLHRSCSSRRGGVDGGLVQPSPHHSSSSSSSVVAWPRRRHPVGVLPATRLLLKAHARWREVADSTADWRHPPAIRILVLVGGGVAEPPTMRSSVVAVAWRGIPRYASSMSSFVSHAIFF